MRIRLKSVFAATALAATAMTGLTGSAHASAGTPAKPAMAGSAQASVNMTVFLAGEGPYANACISATSGGVYMEPCNHADSQKWVIRGSNINGAPYPTVTITNYAWGSDLCLTATSSHKLALVYGGGTCNNSTQAFAMTGPTSQGNYQFFNFTYRACIDSGQSGLLYPSTTGCNTGNVYQLFYLFT